MFNVRKYSAPLAATLIAIKLLVIVALLTGCTAAPNVRVDQQPGANLSGYRTFGFHEARPIDRRGYTSLTSARLEQSTRDELERRGYVYREKNPDLKVSFDLRLRERQELRSYPMNGGVFVRRAGLNDVEVVHYRQGTVSIDLVDNHLKAVVWQGIADGRVDDRMMQEPGKTIDNVVRQIFTGFPLANTGLAKLD